MKNVLIVVLLLIIAGLIILFAVNGSPSKPYELVSNYQPDSLNEPVAAIITETPVETDKSAETEESITAGRVQVERKFIIDADNLPWDKMNNGLVYEFEQSYISVSPEIRLRSVNDRSFYFVLKMPLDGVDGLARQDVELWITEDEYNDLLTKISGIIIRKTRYQFYEDDDTYVTVDVFTDELKGLFIAEVEFDSVEAADSFIPPEWFGEDVTSEKQYKNANLSRDGMPS